MLTEQQKREMQEMAASVAVRKDFELVRKASQLPIDQPMDVDLLVVFLTSANRAFAPLPSRPFVPYTRVLL